MRITCELPQMIKHPDAYLMPIIHMSPFSGKMEPFRGTLEKTPQDVINTMVQAVTDKELNGLLTTNGREAISIALRAIVTDKSDLISIITTSNIGYVSSCVTKEIEKYCRWVFGYKPDATAYFVIHEFGRRATISQEILAAGKPVIEDCAYAFIEKSPDSEIGIYGDYLVYSLPKALTAQYGGVLLSKRSLLHEAPDKAPDTYLLGHLYEGARKIGELNRQRMVVYKAMQLASASYGFEEMLPLAKGDVAHSFIVKLPENINLAGLREYMNKAGIESSVFYGANAYFLPCHQNMNDWEIAYIFYHLHNYIQTSS